MVEAGSNGAERKRSSKKSAVPSKPRAAPAFWKLMSAVVRSMSSRSKESPKAMSFPTAIESTTVQGGMRVSSSATYSGGRRPRERNALTPSAYASPAARARSD